MARCPVKIQKRFLYIMVPIIVIIATSGLIFSYLHFIPTIETKGTQILLQATNIFFYSMSFISYYFAINIKNPIPSTIIPPRIKTQLKNNHPAYTEKKTCEKQRERYKPPRTSHCHICRCIPRMDHHCPYTNSCVGGRNLKAFILFCFYGGLFAVQFLVLSIVYYFKMAAGKVQQISELTVAIWMILSFISFLLSISLNGLALSNIVMAGKNITQIQIIKGIFVFRDRRGVYPNPFDLGFFTNINIVFNGDYWLFWCPTPIKNDYDFTQFPMRPPVTNQQIKILPISIQKLLEDPYIQSIPHTIQQLRKQQQSKYQKVIFYYLNKPYQLVKAELKESLAEINNLKIDQGEDEYNDKEKKFKFQHPEEDKEILASVYD